jgi:TRAP-type C4-dicarboxylate transport system substrate-binding protein
MKKLALLVMLVVIVSLPLLGGCSGGSSNETFTFSSACYLPPTHPFTALQEAWGNDIMSRSNGRITVEFYPGGQLLKANETPDGIVNDIADIAFSHIGYNRGRFPVSEVLDLPMGYPTGWVGTHVATDFMNKYDPKEWDNMHVLFVTAGTTAGLMTRNTKVMTLEDLKGLTLRGAGEVASAIDALGATARDISMVEMADSVSKGVVDGALVGIETLKSFKMADVCKYTTFAWQVGNMYTFYLAMNNEKWNALPNDLKKVFNDVSTEYMEKYAEAWNQIDIDGINYSLSIPGNEVIKLTDAEGQRWWQTVQPVISDYTTTMVGQGYKQSDIEAYLKYIQDRITYWQAEEAKRNIPSPFDVTLPTS